MSNCTLDDKTQRQAAEREYDHTIEEDLRSDLYGKDPLKSINEAKDASHEEQVAHDDLVNTIGAEIPPDMGLDISGAEDKAAVASAEKSLMSKASLLEKALDAPEARLQDFYEMHDLLSGTTVRNASLWQNMAVTIDKNFVDDSAWLKSWSSRYFNVPDQPVQNNPIIRAFHAMQAKVRAMTSKYHRELRGLSDEFAAPIADRLSITVDEALRLLGTGATAKFAPIRNRQLVERWQRTVDTLDQKLSDFTAEEQHAYNDARGKLERYEMYRDDVNPSKTYEESGGAKPLPVHSGYSDAQAAKVISDLVSMGITEAEIDGAARGFSRLHRAILEDRIEAKLVSPKVLEAFPEQSEYYVPMVSRENDNITMKRDGASVYDPGYFHSMEGRSDAPDSAYDTYLRYANRASNEIGKSDLGLMLWAAKTRAESEGRDVGLQTFKFSTIQGMRNSNKELERAIGDAIAGRGGIVAAIPELNAKGEAIGFEKVLIQFDQRFNEYGQDGTNISGKELNRVLSGTVSERAGKDNLFHKATGIYGQLFTRLQPAFAPVNASRDTLERAFHMFNRDVRAEDGTMLSGRRLVPAFLTNVPRANKMLFDYMSGKATGKAQQYGDEYRSMGLLMDYASNYKNLDSVRSVEQLMAGENPRMSPTERMLNRPEFAPMKSVIKGLGKNASKVIGVLDKWNDHFNNSASFDHYVTLREAGVSAKDAAANVLEMMNLYQSGTKTNALRMIFPFVRPTMQSAANMARTLGFTYDHRGFLKSGYKGWATMLGSIAAASALIPMVRAQLGKDENGNDRLDAMSLGSLASFIPIGMSDGSYLKLPTGYGPMQLALTFAYGTDRVQRGTMSATDLAGELLHSFGKNMLPGNWPEFNISDKPFQYVAHALSPAIAQPIIEAATNTGHFGQQLSYASDNGQAKAYQGGMSTPAVYHRLARMIHQNTGWDMSPEQVRSSIVGLSAGPLKIFRALLEDRDEGRRITGKESWANLHPMLAAFGTTMWFGDNFNTTRSLFYNAYHAHEAQWKRAGLKLASDDSNDYHRNKPEEKYAYQRKLLEEKGFTDSFIDNWIALDKAQSAIRKLNSSSNKELKATWQANPTSKELRDSFEALAEQYQEIYAAAVNNINYYR